MKTSLKWASAAAVLVYTGCAEINDNPTISGGQTRIFTAATDYTSSIIGTLTDSTFTELAKGTSTDPMIINQYGTQYILERDLGNIIRLAPDGTVQYQKRIADKFNPHDIAILSETVGYICSYSSPEIRVFNPSTGDSVSTIDLSAYAAAPITLNMDKMALVGTDLYVGCQMMNGWVPGEVNKILKIDTKTGTASEFIRTVYKNMNDMDLVNGKLIVTSTGSWAAVDGGVEEIDLASKTVKVLVEGAKLGIDISETAVDTKRGEYYGTIYHSLANNAYDFQLVHYSSAFTPIDTVAGVSKAGSVKYDSARDKIYFAEMEAAKPAIGVLDLSTKVLKTYKTTLAPQSISFYTPTFESK